MTDSLLPVQPLPSGRSAAAWRTLGSDALLVVAVLAFIASLIPAFHEWLGGLRTEVTIDLSPWALPGYAVLSFWRGFLAYLLSLLFALVYGYWAAKHRISGSILIPLLDIMQSIPVLGFMPGLVIGLIALFPSTNLGLELSAIVMIFTGQVWNMVFSFHTSLTSLPTEQAEAAAVFRFTWFQRLRWVELPAATPGLVWNSMMSMAGGWFFLMVSESFRLGDRDFRLPGLGSYMSQALDAGNWPAIMYGILAMIGLIVVLDQLLWRPAVVWSERFQVDETARTEVGRSWMLDLLGNSRLLGWIGSRSARLASPPPWYLGSMAAPVRTPWWALPLAWTGLAAVLIGSVIGSWFLIALVIEVPLAASANPRISSWTAILHGTGLTSMRVVGTLLLGTLWALPAGLAIGGSPRWSRLLQPVVQIAASFPAPMLFPLCLLVFATLGLPLGVGAMLLMLLGAQWYILFNVIAGAQAIPGEMRDVAVTFRLGWWLRFTRLELPAVFPSLVTGWVTAAGGAWNASIVAEFITWRRQVYSVDGLGSIISRSAEQADYPALVAAIVTMAVVVVVVVNRLVWRPLRRLANERFTIT